MEKVLVAGANGLTGTRIIKILKNHGQYDPVAMIRNEDQKEKFSSMGVDVRIADLEGDLSGLLEGINFVIFAAGSGSSTGKDKTIAVDQEGAIKLIDEAKRNKVKKFVMLSAIGADDPENNEKLQHYLEAKHKADEHLKESGLNYSIIRPGSLTNDDGKGKIKAKKKLSERGRISREDVAYVIVNALDHANTHNQVVEILEGDQSLQEALGNL
jgi:uncharacterized protein YbjT (DUF2867 family)